ncbi:MAG: hypothetical protein QW735_02900 [archaeon]
MKKSPELIAKEKKISFFQSLEKNIDKETEDFFKNKLQSFELPKNLKLNEMKEELEKEKIRVKKELFENLERELDEIFKRYGIAKSSSIDSVIIDRAMDKNLKEYEKQALNSLKKKLMLFTINKLTVRKILNDVDFKKIYERKKSH